MKALSVRQPWAWLIVNAETYPDPKRVENRGWPTKIRAQILIHAGKSFDMDGYNSVIQQRPDLANIMPVPGNYQLGGIVGTTEIVGCVTKSPSAWFFGFYGFELANAKPVPFVPLRGMLGFFEVSEHEMTPEALSRICSKSAAIATIELSGVAK
jgi:hypothetical protein